MKFTKKMIGSGWIENAGKKEHLVYWQKRVKDFDEFLQSNSSVKSVKQKSRKKSKPVATAEEPIRLEDSSPQIDTTEKKSYIFSIYEGFNSNKFNYTLLFLLVILIFLVFRMNMRISELENKMNTVKFKPDQFNSCFFKNEKVNCQDVKIENSDTSSFTLSSQFSSYLYTLY